MGARVSKPNMLEATGKLFDEFRAQLFPEKGFNTADFDKKLRTLLGCDNQQTFDDAIDFLWYETNADPVLVYFLDNQSVKRSEVLARLANTFACMTYGDPELPTHRASYWRDFYDNSDSISRVQCRLNGVPEINAFRRKPR